MLFVAQQRALSLSLPHLQSVSLELLLAQEPVLELVLRLAQLADRLLV